MAVPSTFADLSTTPASNSGIISDASSVSSIDDQFRSVWAFVASISGNTGNGWTSPYLTVASPSYTGTLTGGTGIVNLGSGQFYKSSGGLVGINNAAPTYRLDVLSTAGNVARLASSSGSNLALLRFAANSTTAEPQIGADGDALVMLAGGSTRVKLDSSGNVFLANTAGIPAAPTGGGVLYTNGGALYFLGSAGTSTLIAAA